jgi:hypothetical protein
MKKKLFLSVVSLFLLSGAIAQTCMGGIRYVYTGISQTVWFQDSSSTTIPSPVREYVYWNFGDGATDTNVASVHGFPSPITYWVKREVRYSESGNPSNFCIDFDSVMIDASYMPPTCNPSHGMRVQWLTGMTYGISAYYFGCPTSVYEIVIDSGLSVTAGPTPMTGLYTSNVNFFTYTLPTVDNYMVTHHFEVPAPYNDGYAFIKVIDRDSIPVTSSGCHASFFLAQDSLDPNDWVIYNYSSGGGALTYLWYFGV